MDAGDVLGLVSLLGAGLLAGEEITIRYGVRAPLARLDDQTHIRVRQALIRRLRVLVPAVYLATIVSAATTAIVDGTSGGLALRSAALVALVAWIAVTVGGTVPINSAALDWEPSAPPGDWRVRVDQWERLNSVRAWLAVAAFALLLVATALHVANGAAR
ncbi:MAG TPA: DUF1772 domain-containing protein [Streptosporangiaceae bacterium]|jgi:uncharacterized membrane protein|nr:DUF1772 domain-containing protein [Streptosporangiaceae bacterium]